MNADPAASHETFPQTCRRLIFEARDDCVKRGMRITGEIIERIISEQQTAFNLVAARPVSTVGIAEAIYQAYPRHDAKIAALKAIAVAMRSTPASDLLQRTREYALAVSKWPDSYRYKENRDLVPMPASWFNKGRYMDDQSTWGPHQKKAQTPVNYSKI